jgi:hypothetical protein
MFRGTTPTLEFEVPFDTNIIDKCYVTLAQGGVVVLDKTNVDLVFDGNIIKLPLKQQDTLMCDCKKRCADVQIRVTDTYGRALASNVMKLPIDHILKDGEI